VKIAVYLDDNLVARRAAAIIAAEARSAVNSRGRFIMAVSGGRTPWLMLHALAGERLPWKHVHVVQVDERVAPADDPERNLAHLHESLLDHASLLCDHIHAMPVEAADLNRAARQYALTIQSVAGSPPVLDLVHLGLGPDGHTSSLVPGDPALDVSDADVAATGPYRGRRRMTLTFPIINRSRVVLWLVTGDEKAEMLVRLRDGDRSIPASRVRRDCALILADRAAAQRLGITEQLDGEP
jgi:6-phosphogluconolactonase